MRKSKNTEGRHAVRVGLGLAALLFLLPVFFFLSARLLSAGTLSLSVSRVSAVASGTVALAFFFSLSILFFLL